AVDHADPRAPLAIRDDHVRAVVTQARINSKPVKEREPVLDIRRFVIAIFLLEKNKRICRRKRQRRIADASVRCSIRVGYGELKELTGIEVAGLCACLEQMPVEEIRKRTERTI